MAQMKGQIKTLGKELSNEKITNLSDAEFKTLVIRMLTEMVEYGRKIEEKVKAMKSGIKQNVQGTNNNRKETRTQINSLDQKEEINIQPELNEEQVFKKVRRYLGTLGSLSALPLGSILNSKIANKKHKTGEMWH